MKVSDECDGYKRMQKWWILIHDLLGGTEAMREAGERWLPKEEGESREQYADRLGYSMLYAAYEESVNELANKPFSRPMTVTDLPKGLEYLLADCDGRGTSIGSFTNSTFWDITNYGFAHILVDYSTIPTDVTAGEETRSGARVLWVHIPVVDLIGWQYDDDQQELLQIRYKYTTTVPDGAFGEKITDWIRVYERTQISTYMKQSNGEYTLQTTVVNTLGKIPLKTIYSNQIGTMMAKPPLLNLAWVNVQHWQSSSEQRRILGFSRFAILFGKGFEKKQISEGIDVGPSKAIFTSGENAAMNFVEHSGKAIEAGARDLEDLEQKMSLLGHRPLSQRINRETATSKKINEDRNMTQIQSWIREAESGMVGVLKLSCEWSKIDAPETMAVDIFSDFDVSLYGSDDKEFLLDMHKEGALPRKALLHEVQRRGVIGEKWTVEELLEMVDEEAGKELIQGAEEIDANE